MVCIGAERTFVRWKQQPHQQQKEKIVFPFGVNVIIAFPSGSERARLFSDAYAFAHIDQIGILIRFFRLIILHHKSVKIDNSKSNISFPLEVISIFSISLPKSY